MFPGSLTARALGLSVAFVLIAGAAHGQDAKQADKPPANPAPCPGCPQTPPRPPTAEEARKQLEAVKRQREDMKKRVDLARGATLHEAALAQGGVYVAEITWSPWIVAPNLTTLSEMSGAVVTGLVASADPVLSSDGRTISTVYEVRVAEAHKRRALPDQSHTVKVRVPGGRVTFEDGSVAETRVRGIAPLVVGETYTLFLAQDRREVPRPGEGANRFVPVLGGQGIFHLGLGGTVESYGRPTDPVARSYGGMPRDAFLARLRASVR